MWQVLSLITSELEALAASEQQQGRKNEAAGFRARASGVCPEAATSTYAQLLLELSAVYMHGHVHSRAVIPRVTVCELVRTESASSSTGG